MELGILGALAKDEMLIFDFNNGDVYQLLADKLNFTRDESKSIIVSIMYGMSESTLGNLLDKSEQSAAQLIDDFYQAYPNVRPYQELLLEQGEKHGFVTTLTGLKRKLDCPKSIWQMSAWEKNWLKNFPVQANAAVVFKTAITELAKNLVGHDFKLLVPHYDAIVFQANANETDYYINQVESSMIRAMKKYFPALQPKISIKRDSPAHWS